MRTVWKYLFVYVKKEKKIQGVEWGSMCKRKGLSVDIEFLLIFFLIVWVSATQLAKPFLRCGDEHSSWSWVHSNKFLSNGLYPEVDIIIWWEESIFLSYYSFPLVKPLQILILSSCGIKKFYRWHLPYLQAFVQHRLVSLQFLPKWPEDFCRVGFELGGLERLGGLWVSYFTPSWVRMFGW